MTADPDGARPASGDGPEATGADPELDEAARLVEWRRDAIRFPIRDYEDLWRSLGGEETEIRVGSRVVTLADARDAIPSYYFPIASAPDLVAKLADLAAQGGVAHEVMAAWTSAPDRPNAEATSGWS